MWYSITIFEREEEVGGRLKSIDAPRYEPSPLELGATDISVEDESTLSLVTAMGMHEHLVPIPTGGDSAIWDGERNVAIIPDYQNGWHEWTQMVLQYGTNFIRSLKSAKSISKTLRRLPVVIPFRHIYATLQALGAENSYWWTPSHYLRSKWINGRFVDEVIQAKTRGMYGQNMLNTTSFFFAQAVAPGPRLTLKDGLQQLIERLILSSRAEVYLSHAVSQISTRGSERTVDVHSIAQGEPTVDSFDAVIIAAPWQSTNIEMPDVVIPPANVEYVDRYVTHFISSLPLDPTAFGLDKNGALPDTILTVPGPNELTDVKERSEQGTAPFFSLSKSKIYPRNGSGAKNLYRVLSSQNFTNADMNRLLKPTSEAGADDDIIWSHSKHWTHAWPRADFEDSPYHIQVANGVYSTANLEVASSSIEAAVVMGKNVARIAHGDLKQQHSHKPPPDDDLDE